MEATRSHLSTRTAWLLISLLLSAEVFAGSPVWQVERDGRRLFLAGSIHLLRYADYPLPAAFDIAYARSDMLVFESDTDAGVEPEFVQSWQQASMLPSGQQLDQLLSTPVRDQLFEWLEQRALNREHLLRLRPATAALTLTLMELKQLGVTPDGVDRHYLRRSRKEQKAVAFLETLQQQIEFMRVLNLEQPDQIILNTLDEIGQIETQFDLMVTSWRGGDIDALDRLLVEPMRQAFPLIHQRILVERNADWMPQIINYMETPETELVIVGSAHLVGAAGLLEKLSRGGYKLKQLE